MIWLIMLLLISPSAQLVRHHVQWCLESEGEDTLIEYEHYGLTGYYYADSTNSNMILFKAERKEKPDTIVVYIGEWREGRAIPHGCIGSIDDAAVIVDTIYVPQIFYLYRGHKFQLLLFYPPMSSR